MVIGRAERAWIGEVLGGRVVATRRLKGGISAETRLVTVDRRDGTRVRAVHRRLSDDWIAAEHGIVEREGRLLEELERRGVPAPRLLDLQPEGGLLMSFEPGRPIHHPSDSRRFAQALVDELVRIHDGGPPPPLGYRDQASRLDEHVLEASPWRSGTNADPALWAEVARLWPSVERRPPTLIHDDYHPGNVLWSRNRVSAIVDWTVPGVGQAASDVCYLRLDVSLVRGLDAGDEVLAVYESTAGQPVPDRPFWDLLAATRCAGIAHLWHESWLDFGLTGLTLATVQARLDAFVARTLAEL